MRADAVTFSSRDQAEAKAPRFVTAIMYDVDSLYVTSHTGIENVPGTVIDGALFEPTVTSQRLNPDEAAAEIGTASFSLVDLAEAFSKEVRERLADGAGIRGRQVRFYLGYEGLGFEDFVLIATQVVQGITFEQGIYRVACLDIQRAMRAEIFELVKTTLATSIGAADVVITLSSTDGLERVVHGPGWTDAPNATVGYVRIRSEVIRYTGISGNQLTGCTRGVFGTTASAYQVDPAVPADRREQVTEYVYLELPAVKLIYAILTGQLWGSADVLPPKWHLGIAPELVADEDFTGIGADLWDTTDDAAGFTVRFDDLDGEDGKRFLEKELCLLIGTYMPIYADGSIGLRRMTRLSDDAATSFTLDESNAVQIGALTHDMDSVHNSFLVRWSWNGDEFRRSTAYVDPESRAVHNYAVPLTLSFRGLYGGLHTDGTIFQMLDMVRDRFAGPPLRMEVRVLHAWNRIEIGDVARVRFQHVRDFSRYQGIGSTSIDRAFEVQNVSIDHRNGGVTLELFASTADPTVSAPTTAANSLPDSFYTSEGTALASAPGITIVGDHLTAATTPLTGTADLNAAGSIYYHNGNLTIDAGVELVIANNVQLRVRGFLQINGSINGKGRGHPGQVDDGRSLPWPVLQSEGPFETSSIPGIPGYVGTVRGYDGVATVLALVGTVVMSTWPPHLTVSRHPVAPRLLLSVDDDQLAGLPTDLRGAGGGPGGRVGNTTTVPYPVEGRCGAGGNGGAGLVLICRGMALGANGFVELSGEGTALTTPITVSISGEELVRYAGAGGGGGPGAMYVLLDGGSFSIPDFGGNKFRAAAGNVPIPDATNALQAYRKNVWVRSTGQSNGTAPRIFSPIRGYEDSNFLATDFRSYAGSALVIQHIPSSEDLPVDDPGQDLPPAITAIFTESVEQGINVSLLLPPTGDFDTVQLFASIDNNRANAAKVAEGMFDQFRLRVPDGAFRYFWARTKKSRVTSPFYPTSATAGVPGSALGGMRSTGAIEMYGTTVKKAADAATGWDAAFYSNETYASGAFVSFQPATTTSHFVIGLNSDPELNANYTSIDYGWMVLPDGTLQIHESGALVQTIAAPVYTTNTVLEVRYDGQLVRYFRDGGLVRTVSRLEAVFFVDSSFNTAGSSAKSIKYGPLTTAPSIPFVARGNCEATATTARKNGGANAWDSDVYSFEAYRNGAFVSFMPERLFKELMIGLNSDPLTDSTYSSIDFAWYLRLDGTADIYESGTFIAKGIALGLTSVLAIAYDGKTVRYLHNGALAREVPSLDRTFYMDSAFFHEGGGIRNLTFRPYGSATPVPFLSRGNVKVSDTTAQKIGGTNVWTEGDFVSINGYGSCFFECKPSQANMSAMVGLNSDPYTDMHYSTLDAAWYFASNGQLAIYESNVNVASFGAYNESTVLAITYDGTNARYFQDGVLKRTTSMPGLTMFADGAFVEPGCAINSIRFGPGTTLTQVDTPQLRPDAATAVVQLVKPNTVDPGFAWSSASAYVNNASVASLVYTNNSQYPVNVKCDYKGAFSASPFSDSVSSVRRSAYMQISGAVSYSEGQTEFPVGFEVDPNYRVRTGSVIVGVPAGGSITLDLMVRTFLPAGNYTYADLNIRDVVLNMQGMKR